MKENKKKRVFLSCDEATLICDKKQYKEASLWEKIRLTVHLAYCKACRKYSAKNNKLTKIIKDPTVNCMNISEKEAMKERFKKELSR